MFLQSLECTTIRLLGRNAWYGDGGTKVIVGAQVKRGGFCFLLSSIIWTRARLVWSKGNRLRVGSGVVANELVFSVVLPLYSTRLFTMR